MNKISHRGPRTNGLLCWLLKFGERTCKSDGDRNGAKVGPPGISPSEGTRAMAPAPHGQSRFECFGPLDKISGKVLREPGSGANFRTRRNYPAGEALILPARGLDHSRFLHLGFHARQGRLRGLPSGFRNERFDFFEHGRTHGNASVIRRETLLNHASASAQKVDDQDYQGDYEQ